MSSLVQAWMCVCVCVWLAGMNYYIMKPLKLAELEELVNKALPLAT